MWICWEGRVVAGHSAEDMSFFPLSRVYMNDDANNYSV